MTWNESYIIKEQKTQRVITKKKVIGKCKEIFWKMREIRIVVPLSINHHKIMQ